MSVHVGDPFEGEGTSQDTTVFAKLSAQLPPSGPKPFYSGHYVPKDTVIILRWTAFKVQGVCVCVCVCVCVSCQGPEECAHSRSQTFVLLEN